MAGPGCLIPQDDLYLPEIKTKRNERVRLLHQTATPQQVGDLPLGKNCFPEFRINVEDPDIGDSLTSKWFVSPDPAHIKRMTSGVRLGASPTAIRNEPVRPMSVATLKDLLDDTENRLPGGWHQIEVVVTDGIFLGDGLELVPRDTDPPDQSYVDSYSWFVRPTTTDCAP
jgi:hypothetical protein